MLKLEMTMTNSLRLNIVCDRAATPQFNCERQIYPNKSRDIIFAPNEIRKKCLLGGATVTGFGLNN